MDVSSLGEFGLIRRLAALLPAHGKETVVGIGDDCAAIDVGGETLLLTGDAQVQGRHFTHAVPPEAVGWRLVAANVSDVIACGGSPKWGFLSLSLPGNTDTDWIDRVYRGIAQGCEAYGVDIVGGNTTGSETVMLDLFLIGKTRRFIPRSGAKPGDLIALSAPVGRSLAGLLLLESPHPDPRFTPLTEAHLHPAPDLKNADLLEKYATAAIDISDGLSSDLGHLLSASGTGAVLWAEALTEDVLLAQFCETSGRDLLAHILQSGEEYQILFTFPAHYRDIVGQMASIVGEITETRGCFVKQNGTLTTVSPSGFTHL